MSRSYINSKVSCSRLLASLVPRVCSVILVASRELDLTSDQYLGDEVMFNMLLLSEMLCVPGKQDKFYLEVW